MECFLVCMLHAFAIYVDQNYKTMYNLVDIVPSISEQDNTGPCVFYKARSGYCKAVYEFDMWGCPRMESLLEGNRSTLSHRFIMHRCSGLDKAAESDLEGPISFDTNLLVWYYRLVYVVWLYYRQLCTGGTRVFPEGMDPLYLLNPGHPAGRPAFDVSREDLELRT